MQVELPPGLEAGIANPNAEMPRAEQLLDANVDHLGTWYGAHRSAQENLGSGPATNARRARDDAAAYGQYQELWRVPGGPARGQPSLHSLLR